MPAPLAQCGSAPVAAVELARMPEQTEVRGFQDDWTGIANAAERRKLQNRLNQRLYRKRRADPKRKKARPVLEQAENHASILAPGVEQKLPSKLMGLIIAVSSTDSCIKNPSSGSPHSRSTVPKATLSTRDVVRWRASPLNVSKLETLLEKYEEMAQRDFMLGSPRVDQLLTLIQFNVFRALLSNTKSLGWNLEWLECDDPISPWNTTPEDDTVSCPPSLRPTAIQRKIEHHPWIDLWPIPKMRDNLLLASGLYDEDQLCNDLVEFCDLTNEQSGLIVWGEPWDLAGWEVSETFLRAWAWTINGCAELLVSTNYWRKQRGEKPLKF